MEQPPDASDSPVPGLFTPAFIALLLAELAYFTAAGMEIPLAPLFASRVLGADEVGVGIAVGALAITALFLRPIAGRASDRRGRRPLLIGGALLYAAATAAHAVAPDLTVMVGLRLVLGIAEAFFFVAGFSALADLAPPGRTGEALSFNSLSLYLGVALGPLVGQALLGIGGFTLAWMGAAALALLAALLATRIPETRVAPVSDDLPPVPLIHRASIGPGLGLLSGIAAMAGFFAFVALHAEEIGVADWSLVLLEFGAIVVLTRIVFAKLPDRVAPYRLGSAALALTGAGIAVVALVPHGLGLFVGAGILAVGVAFTTPAFFSAALVHVSPHERGAAMGTLSVSIDLAFGAGPMLFGLVAAAGGIPAAFLAGAGLATTGAIGTIIALRRATTRPLPEDGQVPVG
jgi:predicted MFS family arabinose efflux permease